MYFFGFSSILLTEHISSSCGTPVFRRSQLVETLAERIATLILLALDGGEWLPSRSDHFTPEKEPLYPLKGTLGGPQSRSGSYGEEKSLVLTWIRNPSTQKTAYSVAQREVCLLVWPKYPKDCL
jgi:hypothetical protein